MGFGAATILAVLHLSLYLTLQARPGIAGVVLWYVGPSLLAALAAVLLIGALFSAMRHRQTRSSGRVAKLAVLGALASVPAFNRT